MENTHGCSRFRGFGFDQAIIHSEVILPGVSPWMKQEYGFTGLWISRGDIGTFIMIAQGTTVRQVVCVRQATM